MITLPFIGFLYVIDHPAMPGYFKIGRADNVARRMNDYRDDTRQAFPSPAVDQWQHRAVWALWDLTLTINKVEAYVLQNFRSHDAYVNHVVPRPGTRIITKTEWFKGNAEHAVTRVEHLLTTSFIEHARCTVEIMPSEHGRTPIHVRLPDGQLICTRTTLTPIEPHAAVRPMRIAL